MVARNLINGVIIHFVTFAESINGCSLQQKV